jgi:hypothetical protein
VKGAWRRRFIYKLPRPAAWLPPREMLHRKNRVSLGLELNLFELKDYLALSLHV